MSDMIPPVIIAALGGLLTAVVYWLVFGPHGRLWLRGGTLLTLVAIVVGVSSNLRS